MSDWRPRTAMVLAAGFGKRMRPLTEKTPKPLLELMGQSLIDRVLDRLADAGVAKAVVNTHHLAEQIESNLQGRRRPEIVLRHETELLDTGGSVADALPELGEEPFYVLNGDVFWLEGHSPALTRLAAAWNDDGMDALLLLQETVFAFGYQGAGDYLLDPAGHARRRQPIEVAPFVFTGIQLLHPRLFRYAPAPPFSLNVLYDQAEAAERLGGLLHDGMWFHLSTPQDLEAASCELYDLGFREDRSEEEAR